MLRYDHQTIHQLLETQAAADSTNIALTDGCGFSLSYSNLLKTVDAVIGDLYLAGVDLRDRIALENVTLVTQRILAFLGETEEVAKLA